MLSASTEFRNKVADNPANVLVKATLRLADQTEVELTGDDFMDGGFSFSEAVSSDSTFDVGAAIIGKFSCTLNNWEGKFDSYDFTGATITPFVGVALDNGTIEWIRKGYYVVEQPDTYGNTVALSCLDRMSYLERPYSDVSTTYPATLRTIVQDICSACDVTLSTANFGNWDYAVATRPSEESLTCLKVLGFSAQVSGNWARMNNMGQLELGFYDLSWSSGETNLDGGVFDSDDPYSSGDSADGGDFTFSETTEQDGGTFTYGTYADLQNVSQATVMTDDVVVTGVEVTADGEGGETYLFGASGYVIAISGNPLILKGKAQAVAGMIGDRLVGIRFRPFNVTAPADPTVEAGDNAYVSDGRGNAYVSYVTRYEYRPGTCTYACGAETPSRNSATSFSAVAAAIIANRDAIRREKTDREQAVDELQEQLADSSGLYETDVPQQDGSVIRYLHDKPDLVDSQIVWKMTAEAIGISNDGGETYPYGFAVSGTAILNLIYAIGIDASYINTGSLVVRDPNDSTKVLFRADVSTGVIEIGGFTVNERALYNGLSSKTGSGTGVYVGTDGISTAGLLSDDTTQIKTTLDAGSLQGYQGGVLAGEISPTATATISEDGTTREVPAVTMSGDAIVLTSKYLGVGTDGDPSGTTEGALHDNTLYSTYLAISSYDANTSVVMRPTERRRRVVNGICVSDRSYWYSPLGSSTEQLNLPTKAYVDSKIPTFNLSGNNLYISL